MKFEMENQKFDCKRFFRLTRALSDGIKWVAKNIGSSGNRWLYRSFCWCWPSYRWQIGWHRTRRPENKTAKLWPATCTWFRQRLVTRLRALFSSRCWYWTDTWSREWNVKKIGRIVRENQRTETGRKTPIIRWSSSLWWIQWKCQ